MGLIFVSNYIKQLENIVCKELYKLQLWLSIKQFSLNIAKTNYMLFSGQAQLSDINIKITNTQILRVRVTKFLGVLNEESLNWKDHISRINSKLSISVGIIYRCINVLDRYSLYVIFHSVYARFIILCGNMGKYVSYIFALHNYVTKEGNTAYTQRTAMRPHNSTVLKLTDLVQFRILLFVYKAHKN